MGFASKTANIFNGNTVGEAPQLSSTYAEYDDGANVFTDYWNFAGTALPTNFDNQLGATGASYTVNNGITLSGADEEIWSTSTYSPSILEAYIPTGYVGGGYAVAITYSTTVPATTGSTHLITNAYFIQNQIGGAGDAGILKTVAGTQTTLVSTATQGNPFIMSLTWPATGNIDALWNYGQEESSTDISLTYDSAYITIGIINGESYTFQWLRTRAYPPNGVMPSVSFGSVS
jgi:hypothetical protein